MGNRGGNMANEPPLKREMRWQVIQLKMETIAFLGKFHVKIVIVDQPDSWLPSLNMIEYQDMPQPWVELDYECFLDGPAGRGIGPDSGPRLREITSLLLLWPYQSQGYETTKSNCTVVSWRILVSRSVKCVIIDPIFPKQPWCMSECSRGLLGFGDWKIIVERISGMEALIHNPATWRSWFLVTFLQSFTIMRMHCNTYLLVSYFSTMLNHAI